MPRFHHHLIDLILNLRRKQLHIVFQSLQLIAQIIIREPMVQQILQTTKQFRNIITGTVIKANIGSAACNF